MYVSVIRGSSEGTAHRLFRSHAKAEEEAPIDKAAPTLTLTDRVASSRKRESKACAQVLR